SVAVLTMRQYPRQLHSHLRGSINAGAEVEEMDELLDRLITVSEPAGRAAKELWGRIKAKAEAAVS
ncbi:MAG: hypothetical protein H8E46_08435, partial [FCB group bacterium]|nr:hypothetical protein [FCB group bacterium]